MHREGKANSRARTISRIIMWVIAICIRIVAISVIRRVAVSRGIEARIIAEIIVGIITGTIVKKVTVMIHPWAAAIPRASTGLYMPTVADPVRLTGVVFPLV